MPFRHMSSRDSHRSNGRGDCRSAQRHHLGSQARHVDSFLSTHFFAAS